MRWHRIISVSFLLSGVIEIIWDGAGHTPSIFLKAVSSTNFTWSILEYFVPFFLRIIWMDQLQRSKTWNYEN